MNDSPQFSSTSASGSANPAREKLMESVQELAGHADALLKATASVTSDSVVLARTNLAESLKMVRMQVDRLQALAVNGARQAVQATDSYVRRNPWQAVGIAVAVGFFMSIAGVFARRNTSR